MGHKESDKTYGLRRHTHTQFRELAKPSYIAIDSQDSLLWLSSVQFSHTVVSDSLRPHGLQHTRPPCPSPLSEFTQTYVHWVSDAIQSSNPPSSPSPPSFNLSQHQGLFKWVSCLHQVAKILEFQLQHQFFQWTFRTDSFRMDWLDLLAVQGPLKSLLQTTVQNTTVAMTRLR